MNQDKIKICDIGAYLLKLRKELKWSRDYVARRASVTTRTIYNFELGKHTPRIQILARISAVYDMDLIELWQSADLYYHALAGAGQNN